MKKQKHQIYIILFIALTLIFGLVLACGEVETKPEKVEELTEEEVVKSEPELEIIIEEEELSEIISEVAEELGVERYCAGMYIVNEDIQPGRYKSNGPITYWERLSGFSGELDDIIANDALIEGPVIVDIRSTDVAFETRGSGCWRKIEDDYIGELKTSFGDGMYIVGKDILPGQYKSEIGAGYWARLKGFSGELEDIIANDAFVEGTVIIEIKSSDIGFQTRGAQWTKIN